MENEYNILEEKLFEGDISESEKLRILERQKELLLGFLVDANRNIFDVLKAQKEKENEIENIIVSKQMMRRF